MRTDRQTEVPIELPSVGIRPNYVFVFFISSEQWINNTLLQKWFF